MNTHTCEIDGCDRPVTEAVDPSDWDGSGARLVVCNPCANAHAIGQESVDGRDVERFTGEEYGALLNWLMVSDPWPTTDYEREVITEMLNNEAERRNWKDWTAAYHAFGLPPDPDADPDK